jgi:hypothetical protein
MGNNYLINGDYAGFAQLEIEKKIPSATAFFVLGCAGDQNQEPRGTVELATKHGSSLADQVINLVTSKELKPIRMSFNPISVPFH